MDASSKILTSFESPAVPNSKTFPSYGSVASWTIDLQRGKEEAFHVLYDHYYFRLYRYLLVVSFGDETLTQDALQETMIRVAQKVKCMTSEDEFWRWLVVIARNTLRDKARKQTRYRSMLQRFAEGFLFRKQEPDPGLEVDPEIRYHERLREALATLSFEDRNILTQKYFEGFSVKEIAVQENTTPKAVESKLTRLRVRIKNEVLKRLANEK